VHKSLKVNEYLVKANLSAYLRRSHVTGREGLMNIYTYIDYIDLDDIDI